MVAKAERAGETVIRRVQKKKHEEGHGSAWKVAFADFCLALLCLFLVLWLLAAREKEDLQSTLEMASNSLINDGQSRMMEALGGMNGSMIERQPVPSRAEQVANRGDSLGSLDSPANMLALAELLKQIGAEIGLSANVHTMITPQGLRVMLHDTDKEGMFERGGWTPSPRFAALLKRIAPLFARIDNQMVIAGHTDSLQYADSSPSAMSNWRLSSERAMSARRYLLEGGMPTRSVLQVVGFAESAPLNPENPAAAENRRIELLVLTREQARDISAMFGAPGVTRPLVDGVKTSIPDQSTLEALRGQLLRDERP